MMRIRFSLIFLYVFILLAGLKAQSDNNAVNVIFKGIVFDLNDSMSSPTPIVVNRRSGGGISGMPGQVFSVQGLKTDTFIVSAGGYETRRFCFRDSIFKAVYNLRIGLRMRVNALKPVTIYPLKDLSTLRNERESIGVKDERLTTTPIDAAQSPFTYLYERFSREGKSRATVAMLENEDRKREVMGDLLRLYIKVGVITLKEEEIDAFITFLNIPEPILRTASDYDLAVYVKVRWQQYIAARDLHNHNQH